MHARAKQKAREKSGQLYYNGNLSLVYTCEIIKHKHKHDKFK